MSTPTTATVEADWPHWSAGEMLRKAREDAGYGVAEMASRIGVKRNTITNYEKGHTMPPQSTVVIWEQCTNVPTGSLVSAFRKRFAHEKSEQMELWGTEVNEIPRLGGIPNPTYLPVAA